MEWPHGREVPMIQGRQLGLAKPLDYREDGAVDKPDPKVLVGSHQLGGSRMVGRSEVLNIQLTAGDRV